MSALPTGPAPDSVPTQDETHRRVHGLLTSVTTAALEEQPGLIDFHDHRPQRDRSSGASWRGLQTLCHVSALLASSGLPVSSEHSTRRLFEAVHGSATSWGLHRRSERAGPGMTTASWTNAAGDLLEMIVGVRVAVRAVSAPFLPGSLAPMATTSPASALSPSTPPPRPVRWTAPTRLAPSTARTADRAVPDRRRPPCPHGALLPWPGARAVAATPLARPSGDPGRACDGAVRGRRARADDGAAGHGAGGERSLRVPGRDGHPADGPQLDHPHPDRGAGRGRPRGRGGPRLRTLRAARGGRRGHACADEPEGGLPQPRGAGGGDLDAARRAARVHPAVRRGGP